MSTTIKLLIFDLDGTLVDSAYDYQFALNTVLQESNRGEVSLKEIHDGLGRGLSKLLAKFFPELSVDSDLFKKLYLRFQDVYFDTCVERTRLYPHVLDFLNSWKGHLALVTNKNSRPTHKIMQHLGLKDFNWSLIAGFDTFPHHKPHPFPLLEALRVTNLSPHQAVMIGDGLPDLLAAKAAYTRSMAALFGYNDREFLQSHNPDGFFDCFSSLNTQISRLDATTKKD